MQYNPKLSYTFLSSLTPVDFIECNSAWDTIVSYISQFFLQETNNNFILWGGLFLLSSSLKDENKGGKKRKRRQENCSKEEEAIEAGHHQKERPEEAGAVLKEWRGLPLPPAGQPEQQLSHHGAQGEDPIPADRYS